MIVWYQNKFWKDKQVCENFIILSHTIQAFIMVSISQTDHRLRDKVISYMDVQADMHQYFTFA